MSTATQAEIKRAVEGARKAGMTVGAIEVTKDGTVRVIAGTVTLPPPQREIRI